MKTISTILIGLMLTFNLYSQNVKLIKTIDNKGFKLSSSIDSFKLFLTTSDELIIINQTKMVDTTYQLDFSKLKSDTYSMIMYKDKMTQLVKIVWNPTLDIHYTQITQPMVDTASKEYINYKNKDIKPVKTNRGYHYRNHISYYLR